MNETYTVDASAVSAGGTWTLRVTDKFKGGAGGTLTGWSLQF